MSEVLVTGHSAAANQYAAKICLSLSGALEIPNRGVKTQSLIVLNKTSMPAILVECLLQIAVIVINIMQRLLQKL